MKPLTSIVVGTAIVLGLAQAAAGAGNDAFTKMQSLVGTWQGKDDDGQPATVKYDLMSGGSIVTETLTPDSHPSMLTVYHMDGDKLLCTHYCSRNNQPRLRLGSYDRKTGTLKFDFVDATNLASPEDGHMHSLTLKMPDADHLEQIWDWREGGQKSDCVFNFQRKR